MNTKHDSPPAQSSPDTAISPAEDTALRRLSSRLSLGLAVVLVVVKLAAWAATGSVSLLTSAVDALVDAASSLATFMGVRYAQQPPDADHRFGHGKGEAIAAFTQAVFLGGAAVMLALQSGQRLMFPQAVHDVDLGLWVILGSLCAACALVALQTWVVERTGSTAIAADRAHYLTDIAVNLGVLAALAVTRLTGWERADPLFAALISVYMFHNAYGIARESMVQLLDRELPVDARGRITQAVLACEGVTNMHDLRTRYAGDRIFVEYHLEVDGQLSVDIGHAIGDASEAAVAALLPGTVEVTAHLEPAGIDDERLDDRVAAF